MLVSLSTIEHTGELIGFAKETTSMIGYIHLLTTLEDEKESKSIMIKYLLVDTHTSYNILIGRPSLNELDAINSTPHHDQENAASLRIGKEKKEIDPKAQLVACISLYNNMGDAKHNPRDAKQRAKMTREVRLF